MASISMLIFIPLLFILLPHGIIPHGIAGHELSLTETAKFIHFMGHNFDENSNGANQMKAIIKAAFLTSHKNGAIADKGRQQQQYEFSLHFHLMLVPTVQEFDEDANHQKWTEEEKLRLLLSRLYALARLLTIRFLRHEGEAMGAILAELGRRWDIVKYLNLLDLFEQNTVRLLNWMRASGKFESHLFDLPTIHEQIKVCAMTRLNEKKENPKIWYTVDKKKNAKQQQLLTNDEVIELSKIFASNDFDQLKESSQPDAFEKFLKSKIKNNDLLKAIKEFVLDNTIAVLDERNLALLHEMDEAMIDKLRPGEGLLTYQDQNIITLAVFYKFAGEIAIQMNCAAKNGTGGGIGCVGSLGKALSRVASKTMGNGNKIHSRISARRRRSIAKQELAGAVVAHEIVNLRTIKRKLEIRSEVEKPIKLGDTKSRAQLPIFFRKRFDALEREIGEIEKFKGGIECLNSMDYAKFFKVVPNNFARFMTNIGRSLFNKKRKP